MQHESLAETVYYSSWDSSRSPSL